MSVADGVGHVLFFVSGLFFVSAARRLCLLCGLSQSLAQCSVVNAWRLLRFGVSIQIDAGFQISIYAMSNRVSGCVVRLQSLRLLRRNPICCRHGSGLIFGAKRSTGRLSTASDPPPERWRTAPSPKKK